jgi:adenine specific DNA methylase Mod
MYYIIGRITNSVFDVFETEKEALDWLKIDDRNLFWYMKYE